MSDIEQGGAAKTVFKNNILRDSKLRLRAPAPKGATRDATFGVETTKGMPRFVVRTNVETDEKNGYGFGALDPQTFFAFLNAAEDTLNGLRTGFSVWCLRGKPDEKVKDAKVHFAKETDPASGKEGHFYVALIKKSLTVVKFYFQISDYHIFTDETGAEIDAVSRSKAAARSWVNMLMRLTPIAMYDTYEVPDTSGFNNGGGDNKSKWSKGGNAGGGSYNKPSYQQKPKEPAYDEGGADFGGSGPSDWDNSDGFPL